MARTVREVAPDTYVLNYRHLNQNIGLIVGRDEVAVIDTRSSTAQAREIVADVEAITHLPVAVVIDSHGHVDHAFGNHVFRPAAIWGQRGCPTFLEARADEQRRIGMEDLPGEADDIASLPIDPPRHLVDERATIEIGGRPVELLHLGRGHTDHDLLVRVPDAGAVFAGDLIVRSDSAFFGDAYPLDFPATVEAIGALDWRTLVTGHGGLADREYLRFHLERLQRVVEVARRAHGEGTPWRDLIGDVPLPRKGASDALARAFAQLDGTL